VLRETATFIGEAVSLNSSSVTPSTTSLTLLLERLIWTPLTTKIASWASTDSPGTNERATSPPLVVTTMSVLMLDMSFSAPVSTERVTRVDDARRGEARGVRVDRVAQAFERQLAFSESDADVLCSHVEAECGARNEVGRFVGHADGWR